MLRPAPRSAEPVGEREHDKWSDGDGDGDGDEYILKAYASRLSCFDSDSFAALTAPALLPLLLSLLLSAPTAPTAPSRLLSQMHTCYMYDACNDD